MLSLRPHVKAKAPTLTLRPQVKAKGSSDDEDVTISRTFIGAHLGGEGQG